MRLLLCCLCLVLLGCTPPNQKYSDGKVEESKNLFNAIGGEGNYKTRYERIHNAPASRLCEAIMPLQAVSWTFIPMTEPGVIRWKPNGFGHRLGFRENGGIGVQRINDLLREETVKCTKARNRTSLIPPGMPSEDRECGVVAVKAVCGENFVTYENYERLQELADEMLAYKKRLQGPIRADNEIRCSGYNIGGSTRMRCR